MKPGTKQLLRGGLALAIIACLLTVAPLPALGRALASALDHPWALGLGLGLTFLGLLMGVVRWKVILDAQDVRVPLPSVFSVFFIGQFFNAFMPGACGGDLARAYYAARGFPGRRTEVASTVFVDRAIGLFTTVLWCCLVIALRMPFFFDHEQTRKPGILMLVFLAVALCGILALFRRNLFEHLPLFRKLETMTSVGPFIRRAYDALYLYRRRHGVLVAALLLSFLNLFFLTLACLSFGVALSIGLPHPVKDHLTLFPIITTLAALPITPGALGLREGLFAGLYGALGVEAVKAISMSLLVYAGGLLWSLLGGLFFVRHTAAEHRGMREELDALRAAEPALEPEIGEPPTPPAPP